MHALLLARSDTSARALLAAWRAAAGRPDDDVPRIVVDADRFALEMGMACFRDVAARIADRFGLAGHRPADDAFVVVVDEATPARLSAADEGGTWDNLLALLILALPEVRWLFGVLRGSVDSDFPSANHLLGSASPTRRNPLLDPTGLREAVRIKTNNRLEDIVKRANEELPEAERIHQAQAHQLPRRRRMAAAIDDEVDFAAMHGYAAYRFGFRGDIVSTWALMAERFAAAPGPDRGHGYALVLEDMRLMFSDKEADTHLSELGEVVRNRGRVTGRACHCPLLRHESDTSAWRFLITTGQMGRDKSVVDRNQAYLARKQVDGRGRGEVLFKPLGGLCDLWEESGLRNDLKTDKYPRGNDQWFLWPPPDVYDDLYHGHGAPGKLAVVAAGMIDRAATLRHAGLTVTDFLRAAVLAGDAAELLGGKTPTLTLEAIGLKHECEIRAESLFLGARHHFDLRLRLAEVRAEVEAVARWFHDDRMAAVDAEASILHRLRLVFQQAGQMEEEHQCLVRFRRLNRRLSRPRVMWSRPVRSLAAWPFASLVHLLIKYAERMLESFGKLLAAIAILFALVLVGHRQLAPDERLVDVTSESVGWVFGGSPAEMEPPPAAASQSPPAPGAHAVAEVPRPDPRTLIHVLSWIAVLAGVFHLGLLLSYLYSLASRK